MTKRTYTEGTATLVEVAARAGVSHQTASRVLGVGAHKHRPQTVARVREAARALGYRPNLQAKSMVSGRTRSIGVVLPQSSLSDFFVQVINGIHRALIDTDLLPIFLHASPKCPEKTQIRRLVDRRVDGIILAPTHAGVAPDYFAEITRRHIPVVCVNERPRRVGPVDFVGTAEGHGGGMAADHLLSRGHTRLGCLMGEASSANLTMRYRGFRRRLDRAGAVCEPLRMPGWGLKEGEETLYAWLQRAGRPTAVFCVSDLYAAMVYKAAERLGWRIPDDLSVLGFSGLPWGRYLTPALSTLHQDGERIGFEAARALTRRIEGWDARRVNRRIRVTLVEGASVRDR